MIDRIAQLSEKTAEDKKNNPETAERMRIAKKGQAPRFLIISPIHRSSQDLQVLRFAQGDAFHATRVSGFPLLFPEAEMHLFAGPAAYNRQVPEKTGVILTFDMDESMDIIRESIDSVSKHEDINDIPIIVLRIDYVKGTARLVPHRFGRNYEIENYILKRISQPNVLDDDTLVIVCSDSRVVPPVTPNGVPMAIQTLGAHLPVYNPDNEETLQLNEFFKEWLSNDTRERRIIAVAHGNFEGEGHHCGAGSASLHPETVHGKYLKDVIDNIVHDAGPFESEPAQTAEERVISIGNATLSNIRSYPAVQDAIENGAAHDEFMRILKMDTVTNIVSPYDIEPL
jgi:carbonic anhydrase